VWQGEFFEDGDASLLNYSIKFFTLSFIAKLGLGLYKIRVASKVTLVKRNQVPS
jgi:hypothetical protein